MSAGAPANSSARAIEAPRAPAALAPEMKDAIARALDPRTYPYTWSSLEAVVAHLVKSTINEELAIRALQSESNKNNATIVMYYVAYADDFPYDADDLPEVWTFGLFLAILGAMTTTERTFKNPTEAEACGLDAINLRNIARNLRALHNVYPKAVEAIAVQNRADFRRAARTRSTLRPNDRRGIARVLNIVCLCATRVLLMMEMETQ